MIPATSKSWPVVVDPSVADEHFFYRVVEASPNALVVANEQGQIVLVSQRAVDMFGYSREEFNGLPVEALMAAELREGHKIMRASYQQTSGLKEMGQGRELYAMTKAGKIIAVEIGLSPLMVNQQRYFLAAISDISARKALEDKIKYHNIELDKAVAALTRSNEQLERFAFICSHDLQEPVRMVNSFSQLLAERIAHKLDAEERKYFEFVLQGAQTSRNLISDILTFCRLDQSTRVPEAICLASLCEDLLKTLEPSLQEKQAVFSWREPLPEIVGVRSQLYQLLLNLITNGFKFNQATEPRVRIEVVDADPYWRIEVIDNGIGIAPEHQIKVFDIFQRLNNRRDFTGTGMGLAICKRVVERHQGRIGVASAPGDGSRFYVDWPKKIASLVQ